MWCLWWTVTARCGSQVQPTKMTLARQRVLSSSEVRASDLEHGGSWVRIPSGAQIFSVLLRLILYISLYFLYDNNISGIPYIKLKLGPNSWYTRPTLFVWWGEGLDLCELENVSDMQKCPKTFVNDCSLLNNPGHLRTGEPVFAYFETVAFRL